jgi:hypothetical protein
VALKIAPKSSVNGSLSIVSTTECSNDTSGQYCIASIKLPILARPSGGELNMPKKQFLKEKKPNKSTPQVRSAINCLI